MACARPERPGRLTARILLSFVLVLLTLHATQPPHVHRGTTPGAYNEEHVLASLESTTGDVPLPDQNASVFMFVDARASVPVRHVRVSSTFARHADSRAPPLV